MNRCLLTVAFCFSLYCCFAQSDFIELKHGDKVIQNWFRGNSIYFELQNGSWINAMINKIEFDSLYLRPYVVQSFINYMGFNAVDTTYYGLLTISPHSIKAFPKEDKSYGYIKNGLIFKIGGGGFALLNIINTLSDNQPVFSSNNLYKLGIAAFVFAVGELLSITHKTYLLIGKKYHVEYISTKPSS